MAETIYGFYTDEKGVRRARTKKPTREEELAFHKAISDGIDRGELTMHRVSAPHRVRPSQERPKRQR
jgi:hypothetical protein